MSRNLFMCIVLLLLAGCAAAVVPMASFEEDLKAKEFYVPNNKASVYIYRTTSMHDEEPYMVFINGKMVGFTSQKTYFRFDLEPGKYDIMSKAAMHASLLSLDVSAGKNYFIWQDILSNGFYHLTELQLVSEAEGRIGVLDGKLGAAGISDQLHIERFK